MTNQDQRPEKGNRARIKRSQELASYAISQRNAILDDGFLCHVGYEVEGQPFVIPTAHWRDGNRIYWHGSSKSGMIKALETGQKEACVTVSFLDGLVLARSGFNTSVNYRSAICYGKPTKVTDEGAFEAQMRAFFERLQPGRYDRLRPMHAQEYKATTMLVMDIVDFAVKSRTGGADDDAADVEAENHIWAGHVPIMQSVGAPVQNAENQGADFGADAMPEYFKGGANARDA